ncbi:MAG: hypothetical protein PHC64_02140 [Candidatus Gastranaerophilales bacterium]|nr:hypothetical protein [Candidatus Gastranaerophilales bacterium]
MGLILATVNKQQIIAAKSENDEKQSAILNSKRHLSETVTDLMNAGTDMDPDNPALKQLEERKQRLHKLEEQLDLQLEHCKTEAELLEKQEQFYDKMEESALK